MEPLTKRQREVYDFIASYIAKHSYAPTLEEIGRALNLKALATVHKHLQTLQSKGVIRRRRNRSRSMELTQPNVHEQWATMATSAKPSTQPSICLFGDKQSAIENRDPDEQVCRVRVEVIEIL